MDFLDDIIDFISEGFGSIAEGFEIVFTGEIFGLIGEFFSEMFENIGEFSFFGLLFGLIGAGTIFFLKDYMLMPFLKFYSPTGQMFWGAVTYIGTFIAGYMLGKYFENTG
jgi:hypothetical protein